MSASRSFIDLDLQKREETFRQLICDLSEHVTEDDASRIRYLQIMPESTARKSGLELLKELHREGKFTSTESQPLVTLMKAIKRHDLADIVVHKYQSVYRDTSSRRLLPRSPHSLPSPKPHSLMVTKKRSQTLTDVIPQHIVVVTESAVNPEETQVIDSLKTPLTSSPASHIGYPSQESCATKNQTQIQSPDPFNQPSNACGSAPVFIPDANSSPQLHVIPSDLYRANSLEGIEQERYVSGSSGPPSTASSFHFHFHFPFSGSQTTPEKSQATTACSTPVHGHSRLQAQKSHHGQNIFPLPKPLTSSHSEPSVMSAHSLLYSATDNWENIKANELDDIPGPTTRLSSELDDTSRDATRLDSRPLTMLLDQRLSSENEAMQIHLQATATDEEDEGTPTHAAQRGNGSTQTTWGKKIIRAFRFSRNPKTSDQAYNQLTWKLQRGDLIALSSNYEDKSGFLQCKEHLPINIGCHHTNPYLSFRLYPYGLFKDRGENVTLYIKVTIPDGCPPIDPSAKFLLSWRFVREEMGKKINKPAEASCKFSMGVHYGFNFLSHSILKKTECREFDILFTVSTSYCVDTMSVKHKDTAADVDPTNTTTVKKDN